jgi:aminoglycoside 6'-N-acetyltransferase
VEPRPGRPPRPSLTDEAPPVLRGERVRLRPLRDEDAQRLHEILREPEVARWFGMQTPQEVTDELMGGAPTVTGYAIEVEGELVGAIQSYENADPAYRHAGMDVFVASAQQNRGLGTEALRVLARYLFEERGHHRLVIDPAATNTRAIRAYERVGFRPVGIMRAYELGPDGTFHDGLLMDLLRDELA